MRAISSCLPWAPPRSESPVSTPRQSGDGRPAEPILPPAPPTASTVELQGLPPPVAPPSPRQPPRQLPRGAREPTCSRSRSGERRSIETEHFRYVATRPEIGRLWAIEVTPVSAGAQYYIEARGQGLSFACPLATLPNYIAATERDLAGYWGMALDTRREW